MRKPLPRDGSGGMIELIGQAGGPDQLRKLFDQALSDGFTDDAMARALSQLAEAARLRNAKPSGDLSTITRLVTGGADAQQRVPTGVASAAARLAGTWNLTAAAPALTNLSSVANAAPQLRSAACT